MRGHDLTGNGTDGRLYLTLAIRQTRRAFLPKVREEKPLFGRQFLLPVCASYCPIAFVPVLPAPAVSLLRFPGNQSRIIPQATAPSAPVEPGQQAAHADTPTLALLPVAVTSAAA